MNAIVFSINDKIYFHSSEFIETGKLQVIGKRGRIEIEFPIRHCVFGSYQTELSSGNYLVRLYADHQITEKQIHISKGKQPQ